MKYIIILVVLSILLIIFYFNMNVIEGYDKWDLKMYNQNWNKPWKDIETAYNDPYVQDIPRSSNNDPNFPTYILDIVKENNIIQVLSSMQNRDIKVGKLEDTNISWDDYFRINKGTWYNSLNKFNVYSEPDFKTHKSCLPQVNKVLDKFLNEFNTKFSKTEGEQFVRQYYGYSPFSIYKYRVHHIKQKPPTNKDEKCLVDYGLIVVLIRNESYVGTTLYLNYISQGDKIDLVYYDLIGYYPTSDLFLPNGKREVGKNKFYEINPLYRISKRRRTLNEYPNKKNWSYLNVNYNNADYILWKQKNYNFDNTLMHQHTCFNAEPQYYNPSLESNSQPILNYVYNKFNCEAKYDQYGRRKPKGKWDRPCLKDNECIFYGKNKNYPNTFGKCNLDYGFCELPRGMKNLGYHYYYPFDFKNTQQNQNYPVCNPKKGGNPAPLCYNCNSVNKDGKWKPITALDTCCEEQKNKNLYPHLKSPDYAFGGDMSSRLNSNYAETS